MTISGPFIISLCLFLSVHYGVASHRNGQLVRDGVSYSGAGNTRDIFTFNSYNERCGRGENSQMISTATCKRHCLYV